MRTQLNISASTPINGIIARPLTKKGLLKTAQRENELYNMPPEQVKLTIDKLWEHLIKLKKSFPQNNLIRLKLLQDDSYILGEISPIRKGSVLTPTERVSGYIFTDGANFAKCKLSHGLSRCNI